MSNVIFPQPKWQSTPSGSPASALQQVSALADRRHYAPVMWHPAVPPLPFKSNFSSIPAPSCRKARFLGSLEAMPFSWRWLRRVALPATHAHPPAMFSVTKAEATAIRDAFHQRGELSAVIELRRLFPGVTDNRQARECVRMIAGWRLSEPDQPRRLRKTSTS